jgi:hypothetical protein
VRPAWVSEDSFQAAHRELDEALPGSGSLAERYQTWREGDGLRGDALAAVFDAMAEDFRSRTAALLELPEGESRRGRLRLERALDRLQLLPRRPPQPNRRQH